MVQNIQMSLPIQRSHFDGLVVFLAVAELRGFRAAPRQLGLTPFAISQTIRTLETGVGAPLSYRTTRSVGLTEAGERLLQHARPAIDMLSPSLDAAAGLGNDISGRLRISLPRPAARQIANRLLPGFLEHIQACNSSSVARTARSTALEGGYDAGIRPGRLVRSDMTAVLLTHPIRYAVVGSSAFVRKKQPTHAPSGA
jgi:DNA-binding transcriptional LysR family regulator